MKSFLLKKELKREELTDRIDELNNFELLKLIECIENEINSHKFKSNKDYLCIGRKKHLINELETILNEYDEHKYVFSKDKEIGRVLVQFVTEGNQAYAHDVEKSKWVDGKIINNSDLKELRDKCDRYTLCGIICLEEKQDIINIIEKVKNSINKI